MQVDGYVITADDRERARELFQRAEAMRREADTKTDQANRLEAEARRLLLGIKPKRRSAPEIRVEEMTLDRYMVGRG